jgi:hypothetical protein
MLLFLRAEPTAATAHAPPPLLPASPHTAVPCLTDRMSPPPLPHVCRWPHPHSSCRTMHCPDPPPSSSTRHQARPLPLPPFLSLSAFPFYSARHRSKLTPAAPAPRSPWPLPSCWRHPHRSHRRISFLGSRHCTQGHRTLMSPWHRVTTSPPSDAPPLQSTPAATKLPGTCARARESSRSQPRAT